MSDISIGAAGPNAPLNHGQTKKQVAAPAPNSTSDTGDSVTLSNDATELLSGKNPKSPAHRAREALLSEEYAALSNLPFGKLVSTLAKGLELSSLLPKQDSDAEPDTIVDVIEDGYANTESDETATQQDDETVPASALSSEEQALNLLTA